ncbi:MAG: hypothetical protein FJ265_04390, partial [Planctomycetes bacterium]|nr:hypothetical protein [Planctomycetota bacterium]
GGVFTIALYDRGRRRLLLVRDHLGSRSLFWARCRSGVLFASTVRALLATGLVARTVSPAGVDLYLAGTCVPHPDTILETVKALRPGYATVFENGTVREHEYWRFGELTEQYQVAAADFRERIKQCLVDSIRIRAAYGNRPYGAVLSGGVDTSVIAAVLASLGSEQPLQTFAIGFEEGAFDDSGLQKIMVDRWRFANHTHRFAASEAADAFASVVRNLDTPVNNSSAMGTFLCMRLVKSAGLDVVFEGEAADEIFCGGGGVVGEQFVRLFTWLPRWFRRGTFGLLGGSLQMDRTGRWAAIRRLCHRISMPEIERMLTWLPLFDRESRRRLLAGDWRRAVGGQDELASGRYYMEPARFRDALNLYQFGACKTYLANDLLYKNERMAAANGVVNRTPFIDHRLVELGFTVPGRFKITGRSPGSAQKKKIYREAIAGMIPDEILWRRKLRGFSQPVVTWIRNGLKELVMDTLLGRRTAERGMFDRTFLERIVMEHMNGVENRHNLIWSVLTLESWLREFVDGR